MENLGNFKCPQCNLVHSGISETDAITAVNEFNDYFAALSLEVQAEFGGKPASLETYKKCARCGATATTFLPASPGDSWAGQTLQVVIATTMVKERDAISSTNGGKV
jgi:phage FluMu protein Com